ncbi:MAG: phosphorylase [Methylohalobius sp. ZOD2]
MLGIVVALPAECRTLTRQRVSVGQLVRLTPTAMIQVAGMGSERALAAADILYRAGASAVLSWGVAAGLQPELTAGTLVLPRRLLLSTGEEITTDPHWWSNLHRTLADLPSLTTAPLAGSDHILKTPTDKKILFDTTGAAAVDMESAFLARWAIQKRIPFAALRAISDTAGTALPGSVLAATGEQGDVSIPRLLGQLLRHPGQIRSLITLGRQFNAARLQLNRTGERLGANRFCLP